MLCQVALTQSGIFFNCFEDFQGSNVLVIHQQFIPGVATAPLGGLHQKYATVSLLTLGWFPWYGTGRFRIFSETFKR
jgi:hypothetical protein